MVNYNIIRLALILYFRQYGLAEFHMWVRFLGEGTDNQVLI